MANKTKKVYSSNYGGKREGAGTLKKYSCEIIKLQTTIPAPSKDIVLALIESERKKYLV